MSERPMLLNMEVEYLDKIREIFKLKGTITDLFDRLKYH